MTRIEFYQREREISGRKESVAWSSGWGRIDGKKRSQQTGVPSKRLIFTFIQFLH